ncbi:MAG: amidohydrolase [Vicinamibacterales bacterium]|jgi:amidohydrolase|nr:amidohydrolase [Vicinamibacterales bacterium]
MTRRITAAVAALLAVAAQPAGAAITETQLDQVAKSLAPQVITWRRDFHQNPELGNRETRTAQKVAEHLKALGLEVKTGIAHTGVVGVLKGGKPGPTIALRADMDALPVTEQVDVPFKSLVTSEYRGEKVGVMHACGHDAHTAILMGTAQALAEMRKDLPGTVLFIFQPAEEGAPDGEEGGAPLMLEEGVFDIAKPEAAFGLHVWSGLNAGQIGYRSGPFMAASDRYRIVVKGEQTHGSKPWGGVDPIVASAQIVMGLQTLVSRQIDISAHPAVVSVGAIKGGVRNNIIPDQVEMIGTFRTFDPKVRQQIIDGITRTAKDIASSSGASAEVEVAADANPVTFNDVKLTERMLPSLERAAGPGNVLEIPFVTGAEDFSYFGQRVPSLFFFVGITPPGRDAAKAPSNHSPKFYIDESGLELGVRAMLGVAVDYLQGGRR